MTIKQPKYKVTENMVQFYFFGDADNYEIGLRELTRTLNTRSDTINEFRGDIIDTFINADCEIHEQATWHCSKDGCCDCRTKHQIRKYDWPIGCKYDHE
jgi:hypothetical protein